MRVAFRSPESGPGVVVVRGRRKKTISTLSALSRIAPAARHDMAAVCAFVDQLAQPRAGADAVCFGRLRLQPDLQVSIDLDIVVTAPSAPRVSISVSRVGKVDTWWLKRAEIARLESAIRNKGILDLGHECQVHVAGRAASRLVALLATARDVSARSRPFIAGGGR